jgi:signal transduction histidine kinase
MAIVRIEVSSSSAVPTCEYTSASGQILGFGPNDGGNSNPYLPCQRGLEHPEPLDLADITRNVLLARQAEADRHDIHLIATLAAAPATGDPSLAESLVANLIDNAIRHNLPGGQAEITTAMTAGGAAITVSNTGTLIPPGEVEDLFQPFRQLGTQRIRHGDGHGLGLAIVRAIADAHGADLTPRARPRGGLDVEVIFP